MGRPYISELSLLSETYRWACRADLAALSRVIDSLCGFPLLVVGSGGSLTAAHLVANAHEQRFGLMAKACTPLELVGSLQVLSRTAVLIISSGGRNADVLAALRHSIKEEVERIGIVCGSIGSPLIRLGHSKDFVVSAEFKNPAGRDGFLAVNSLMAFAVLLSRAYDRTTDFPASLEDLTKCHEIDALPLECSVGDLEELVECETLLVMYGRHTKAAAIDIESRFAEAALGRVLLADFRNFAHGRHNWLAMRREESGVLALCSMDEVSIAKRTLALLPEGVPRVMARLDKDSAGGSLAGLVYSIALAGIVGRARGVDPGRPSVPDFGRRIYHLRDRLKRVPSALVSAARRKAKAAGVWPLTDSQESTFMAALDHQVSLLQAQMIRALVVDYDGTLCAQSERFTGPSAKMGDLLNNLLEQGIILAIATGRGKSVRSDLQRLIKHTLWRRVLVGYYNGGDIGTLHDDQHPDTQESTCNELESVADSIKHDPLLGVIATITWRQRQITLNLRDGTDPLIAWRLASDLLERNEVAGVRAVASTHSVDVVAPGVSKMNLIRYLSAQPNPITEDQVLCIGDRGAWPGNDYELLHHRFALSVNEVSPDLGSGWNIAPTGCRGTEATRYYLERMAKTAEGFTMRLPRI